MKKLIFLVFLLFFKSVVYTQELSFSDSAEVSLLTCSPGKELYAQFGHSAIRIVDHPNQLDVVFNYGVFSFQTEGFYFKFIHGETDYMLGVHYTDEFLWEYEQRNSTVWEQKLNLSKDEKNRLIADLLFNFRPENIYYRYNFVFDNCATRPRDKVLNCLSVPVTFGSATVGRSFRDWIGVYVGQHSWTKFGIDLIFGRDADKIATVFESLFLPEVLMKEFAKVEVNRKNGSQHTPLLMPAQAIVEARKEAVPEKQIITPLVCMMFVLFLGIGLFVWELIKGKYYRLVDSVLFFIVGLIGVFLSYMSIFSLHPFMSNNCNLLWLSPLNILLAIFLLKSTKGRVKQVLAGLNMFLLFLVFAIAVFSVQQFNVAVYPLLFLLLMRNLSLFRFEKTIFVSNKKGK